MWVLISFIFEIYEKYKKKILLFHFLFFSFFFFFRSDDEVLPVLSSRE